MPLERAAGGNRHRALHEVVDRDPVALRLALVEERLVERDPANRAGERLERLLETKDAAGGSGALDHGVVLGVRRRLERRA